MDVFTEETKTIERIASAREFLCKPLHQHIYIAKTLHLHQIIEECREYQSYPVLV
jgi:hypothetical protein